MFWAQIIGHWEFFCWLLCFFALPSSLCSSMCACVSTSFIYGFTKCSRPIFYIFCSNLRISHFTREPFSILLKNNIRSQALGATRILLLLGPLSGVWGHICVYANLYIKTYLGIFLTLCICMKLNIKRMHTEISTVNPLPHGSSRHLPPLAYLSLQQSEIRLPLLTIHLLNCSNPVYLYSSSRIVKSNPVGNNFINWSTEL